MSIHGKIFRLWNRKPDIYYFDKAKLKMLHWTKSRSPSRQEIFPVFSIILFITFTWSLYVMFWTLPSWLGDMNIWRILELSAYILSFTLIESLILLFGMLLLTLLLPSGLFKNWFVPTGSVLVIVFGIGAYLAQPHLGELRAVRNLYLLGMPLLFIVTVLLLVSLLSKLFEHFQKAAGLVSAFADRMTVFSYLYLPLGLLSLVITVLNLIL